MTTAKLTQDLVDKGLQCPADKRRVELCDTVQPGLYVEVRETAPGEGTYYLRQRIAGKARHEKLGPPARYRWPRPGSAPRSARPNCNSRGTSRKLRRRRRQGQRR